MKIIARLSLIGASAIAILTGCASQNGYQKAFSDKTALTGNSHTFSASTAQTMRAVKQSLVRQGFTIEHVDPATGLIKAVRNLQDSENKDVSYNINLSADVTEAVTDQASIVTLAASQQTVLHREWYTWWHLLWIIPLFPTGTEYQTVVTKEGNVTDVAFYTDFFGSVGKVLSASKPADNAQVPTPAPTAMHSSL